MKAKILDGRKTAKELRKKLREQIKKENLNPKLAVILVGDDPASKIYVNLKEKACKKVGIATINHHLKVDISEAQLTSLIQGFNRDQDIHGILLQLPLPSHLNEEKFISMIDPAKDVDGFHPVNVGKLVLGKDTFVSATPKGVMTLLKAHNIKIEGKEAVVIGRSNNVGKPMASLLLAQNATVTTCHSRTKNMKDQVKKAEILVVASGKRGVIDESWIQKDCVVVDVGIHRLDNGKVGGDLHFEKAASLAAWITPVPGGVGPMTIASLLENTVKSALDKSSPA